MNNRSDVSAERRKNLEMKLRLSAESRYAHFAKVSKHENKFKYTHAGTAAQDGRLLACRQLSVGRTDLSLRQSAAKATTQTFRREAAGGRALGHDAGTEFYLCASEPGHQKI
jgi:hypothetical protein